MLPLLCSFRKSLQGKLVCKGHWEAIGCTLGQKMPDFLISWRSQSLGNIFHGTYRPKEIPKCFVY